MDLCVPWDGREGGEAMERRIAELRELLWTCVALDVPVDADEAMAAMTGRAWTALEDSVRSAPRSLEQQLPRMEELKRAFGGQFPAQAFSERDRSHASQGNHRSGDAGALEVERYSRVTLTFASPPSLSALLREPVLKLFDLIAVKIDTARHFSALMALIKGTVADRPVPFDLIQLNLAENKHLPFTIGSVDSLLLRQRGVFVELLYTHALPTLGARGDDARQRALACALGATTHLCSRGHMGAGGGGGGGGHGHGLVLCSSGKTADGLQLRRPEHVTALARLLGLRELDAAACVTTTAQAVVTRAERRRRRGL